MNRINETESPHAELRAHCFTLLESLLLQVLYLLHFVCFGLYSNGSHQIRPVWFSSHLD